jgi:hypothetical protein
LKWAASAIQVLCDRLQFRESKKHSSRGWPSNEGGIQPSVDKSLRRYRCSNSVLGLQKLYHEAGTPTGHEERCLVRLSSPPSKTRKPAPDKQDLRGRRCPTRANLLIDLCFGRNRTDATTSALAWPLISVGTTTALPMLRWLKSSLHISSTTMLLVG